MSFLAQHGLVVSALLAAPFMLLGFFLCILALRRYEVVFVIIVFSAWIHWAFATNAEAATIAEGNEETGASYIRIALVLLASALGYIQFLQRRAQGRDPVPPRLYAMGTLALLGLASTAWSVEPGYSFIRAAEFAAFLGFLLGLHKWLDEPRKFDRLLDILCVAVGIGILINAASVVVLPGRAWWWEATSRLQGVTNHPNELGMFCMIAYPLLLWQYARRGRHARMGLALLLMAAAALHLLSGSRSSLICAGAGLLVWTVLSGQWGKAALMASVGCVFGLLILTSALPSLERTESESITDLTGRTAIWEHSVALVRERPLLGYGYQVSGHVWNDPRFASDTLQNSWASARTSLHNGYLDTLIGQGILGLILMACVILAPIPGLLRNVASPHRIVTAVLVAQVVLINCTETTIIGSRSYASVVFWTCWVVAGRLAVAASARPARAHGVEPSAMEPAGSQA